MKLRRRRQQEKKHRSGEIPTGSFSDIAFLLIIYFLVVTSLVKNRSISVDMPTGEKTEQAQADKTPTINLRGNDIYFGEDRVNFEGLNQRLAVLKLKEKDPKDRVVLLESTPETAYDLYYQALAAINTNGGVVALVQEEDAE